MQFINTPELEDRRHSKVDEELGSDELARITKVRRPTLLDGPECQTMEECDIRKSCTKMKF